MDKPDYLRGKTVHVLIEPDADYDTVLGVFSTPDAARAWLEVVVGPKAPDGRGPHQIVPIQIDADWEYIESGLRPYSLTMREDWPNHCFVDVWRNGRAAHLTQYEVYSTALGTEILGVLCWAKNEEEARQIAVATRDIALKNGELKGDWRVES